MQRGIFPSLPLIKALGGASAAIVRVDFLPELSRKSRSSALPIVTAIAGLCRI